MRRICDKAGVVCRDEYGDGYVWSVEEWVDDDVISLGLEKKERVGDELENKSVLGLQKLDLILWPPRLGHIPDVFRSVVFRFGCVLLLLYRTNERPSTILVYFRKMWGRRGKVR